MSPKPGEIYLIDLGYAGKVRPAIVASREDPESPRAICMFIPITSEHRGSRYEVSIGKPGFLREPESWANVQAISTVGHEKIIRFLGKISARQMMEIKEALRFALEI